VAITTYTELLAAGDAWITRTDMGDIWPSCVALAEAVANRLLDCREMRARTAAFAIDAETEALPTGFGGVKSFRLNTNPRSKLDYVKPDEFDEICNPDAVGRPTRYTIIGSDFVFDRTPDTAYTATLAYRKTLTALSISNASNWLLAAHPDVYLHGVLAFGYQYWEDTEEEGKFMSNFLTGIGQVNANDQRQSYGSAPSRRVRGFN
jgi:hypothetical protein